MRIEDLLDGDNLSAQACNDYVSRICGAALTGGLHLRTFVIHVEGAHYARAADMLFKTRGRPDVKHDVRCVKYTWNVTGLGIRLVQRVIKPTTTQYSITLTVRSK
jgi:hypothetical protein